MCVSFPVSVYIFYRMAHLYIYVLRQCNNYSRKKKGAKLSEIVYQHYFSSSKSLHLHVTRYTHTHSSHIPRSTLTKYFQMMITVDSGSSNGSRE